LGRPRHKESVILKLNLRKLDLTALKQLICLRSVLKEGLLRIQWSITVDKFNDQFSYYQVLKKYFVPWRWLRVVL